MTPRRIDDGHSAVSTTRRANDFQVLPVERMKRIVNPNFRTYGVPIADVFIRIFTPSFRVEAGLRRGIGDRFRTWMRTRRRGCSGTRC